MNNKGLLLALLIPPSYDDSLMNFWLFLIISLLLFDFFLDLIAQRVNLKALVPELPSDFADIYDSDEYSRSQQYTRATTRLAMAASASTLVFTLFFFLANGFQHLDSLLRSLNLSQLLTGILFIAILAVASFMLSLPFSLYTTFGIEARFGFNKTTPATYLLDLVKGCLLGIILGIPLLSLILWFFMVAGPWGWLYCFLTVFLFTLLLQYLAPILIMPLFNKFEKLQDGQLRQAIEGYAKDHGFAIAGIYTMDGSKRSTKANAFFTGFGRYKKIVFFDTLLDQFDTEETLAVLAHEMGHFKLGHIKKTLLISFVQTGLLFYILSLFLSYPEISQGLGMEHASVYSGLVFFGFLFSPVNRILAIGYNGFSRRNEFAADSFAAKTTKTPDALISGLKKLSAANLANLTPHPLVVFLYHSHPPLRDRINNLTACRSTRS